MFSESFCSSTFFSGPWQNSHNENSIHASGAGIWGWNVKSAFGTVTGRTADGQRDSEAPCQLQKVRGPERTTQAGSLRCRLALSHLILCITSGRRGNELESRQEYLAPFWNYYICQGPGITKYSSELKKKPNKPPTIKKKKQLYLWKNIWPN